MKKAYKHQTRTFKSLQTERFVKALRTLISLKLRYSVQWNEIDLDELKGLFRYHFIESLILAQDERWRRA